MATKVFDGFDHYNAQADVMARSGWLQWQLFNNPVSGHPALTVSVVSPGRNGLGKCLSVAGSAAATAFSGVFADRNAEGFFGYAIDMAIAGPANGIYVYLRDSTAGVQLTVHFNEVNYAIEVYRGDLIFGSATYLGTSGNNAWTNDTWQFHEIHYLIASSGGKCEVSVNNQIKVSITGANTQATTNAWADLVSWIGSPWSLLLTPTFYLDDFYYNDNTSGPGLVPANSFMGDCSVVTLVPIGNDSVQFTPFANTNWQEVSELAMDSDVSYNYTSTVGNEDRFNYQTITAALDTVYAVQVTGAYRKDDGGTRTIEQLVKSGSTEVYSSGHNIPDTNYAYFTDLWVLNPATSLNWTKIDINAMKAGYKLTA